MPVLMSVLMHGTSVPRVVKSTRESRSSRPPKRGGVVVPLSLDHTILGGHDIETAGAILADLDHPA
ncbi:hypothetical protein, partial [Bradyrhizobium diazoefficiens]|uniref:hypothetical protein n=1 Tax=Bradyrhizobium diazoefficiens TaxID=1355477 RepID=UPI001B8AF87A